MSIQLQLRQNLQNDEIINNFDDIMRLLYISHSTSFLEEEDNLQLSFWERFKYTSIISFSFSFFSFFGNSYLFFSSLIFTLIISLLISCNEKSSPAIFSILSPFGNNFRTKVHLSRDIQIYKKNIATPILKNKKNQLILLHYYTNFYEKNKIYLSIATLEDLENLKDNFENNKYELALDCIYNLYKKIRYVETFNDY